MQRSDQARARSHVVEVIGFVVIGALLLAAIGAALMSLYRSFWGPSAFAERYVQLLAEGRASDALMVEGVGVDSEALAEAGLPDYASDALLRSSALSTDLVDIRAVGEKRAEDGTVTVTVGYRTDGETHESAFLVEQTGWHGLVPSWRFAQSPLTVIDVDVHGSWRFEVNGFELDKRQVSSAGLEADPSDAIPMLAFTPETYDFAVDTATTEADPVTVDATEPLTATEATVEAEPSREFQDVIDQKAEDWLSDQCGARNVLMPEECPYGYELDNLVAPGTEPEWTISEYPDIVLTPDGPWWDIEPADGVAHIDVDVQSYIDGSITHVSQDVPFRIDGTVELLEDGSAKIQIGAPLLR